MHIERYQGCGAEVTGVQLARLTEAELDELREAFREHGVLFFRDQELTPEDHIAFARRWGPIVVNKFFEASRSHPEIALVRKEKDQKTNIGGGWHADHSYDEEPALGSILVARDLPPAGGNTHFADLRAAWNGLDAEQKDAIGRLRGVHSNLHLYGENGIYRKTDLADQLGGLEDVGQAVHPAVIAHPESGHPVLYVNPGHTIQFEGMTPEASRPLLDALYEHVTSETYTCQFVWRPGSIAFWDNRCTWHFAPNDYQGHRREMHRITLAGSRLEPARAA